jgi:ornithine carbamoyltransferase
MRHFLDLLDLTSDELVHLLSETARLKTASQEGERTLVLQGRVLGMVFEKPSLRTRASFQSAMAQLGGSSVFMTGHEAGMGTRESIPDFARVMSQYADAIVLRTFSHKTVQTFADYARCPVINGLSDYHHPCQALADLFTVQETFGDLKGRTIAFIGDGNNVARSLAICCGKLGVRFVLAAGFESGYQSVPVDWGIHSERKKCFLRS